MSNAPASSPSTSLPPRYDAAAVQDAVAKVWEEERLFHAEPGDGGEPFCIVIPPPNVTGALHLGHALNNTIQDILVRRARMQGKNAVWIPGTDHAGIATQAVVDKRLQAEGQPALKDYKKLEAAGQNGREQFIAKVQAWKDEYEQRILGQLKAMGCSCDFERTAFTMDEPRARAVREAFFRLFKDGLIYRGKRLVNWDPATQTALADDEVENEEVDGHFYYLRYPLESDVVTKRQSDEGAETEVLSGSGPSVVSEYVTVATTRPETMLGDTAIAINPKDPRAASLRGRFVRLPIVNRLVPIIEDEYVVMADPESDDAKAKYATGFLKVTPAHDPNDWDIGQRHNLPVINVFAPDATISDQHGWPREDFEQGDAQQFLGLDRYEARRAIVAWFRDNNLLEDTKPYRHSVGHSYRSHVPIEPYLSDQWYVAVKKPIPWMADEGMVEGTDVPKNSLAGLALTALDLRGQGFQPVSEEGRNGQDALATQGQPRGRSGETSAEDGSLSFVPDRYAKTFRQWHENLRDWCISRQLWWGHRIPVWRWAPSPGLVDQLRHCRSVMPSTVRVGPGSFLLTDRANAVLQKGFERTFTETAADSTALDAISRIFYKYEHSNAWIDRTNYWLVTFGDRPDWERSDVENLTQDEAALEKAGWIRDPDVLDTWFSSALWPLSTLGWPEKTPELAAWNPTDVLCTAREIITLWVSRMVMFNRYLRAHPDEQGTKARRHEGTKGPESEEGGGAQSDTSCLRASVPSCLPFKTVFIHAMIQDGEGRKMSKSLGNGVDPLDIIESHGADAMRFTLAQMTTNTQDVRMPVVRDEATGKNTSPKFDLGRNFSNKLWNAGRFVISGIAGAVGAEGTEGRRHEGTKGTEPEESGGAHSETSCLRASVPSSLPVNEQAWSVVDRWILSRLARTVQAANEAIEEYRFDRYATACYDFFWRDFCDWYVEASKPAMKAGGEAAIQTAHVLATCLDVSLRLMHPMIPFATERLWWALNEVMPATNPRGIPGRIDLAPAERLIRAAWPSFDEKMDTLTSSGAERVVERLQEITQAIRTIRTENKVDPRKSVPVVIRHQPGVGHLLIANKATIELWANCDITAMGEDVAEPENAAKTTAAQCEVFVAGMVDPAAEAQRLARERGDLEKKIATLRGRLANKGYTEKAPAHLVQQTRDELANAEAELAALG